MSTMVYQGLQSCLEPQFVEPQTFGLKMVATKSQFLQPMSWARPSSFLSDLDSDTDESTDENNNINISSDHIISGTSQKDVISEGDTGGMSFFQSLTNSSPMTPKEDVQKHYVHPLVKQYSSSLSEKSLELCTETLGCETGSNYTDIDMCYLSSSDTTSVKSMEKEQSKLHYSLGSRKEKYGAFPPPLTSISGSNCVNIRPHREGGRLVMKAVLVPSLKTCFQSERHQGRLKLHFVENTCDDSDFEAVEGGDEEEAEQVEEAEAEAEQVEHEHEREENVHEYDQHKDEIPEDYLEEDRDGSKGNDKAEMGMGKFARRSRCKESGRGNKRLLIWEPCWVATS